MNKIYFRKRFVPILVLIIASSCAVMSKNYYKQNNVFYIVGVVGTASEDCMPFSTNKMCFLPGSGCTDAIPDTGIVQLYGGREEIDNTSRFHCYWSLKEN